MNYHFVKSVLSVAISHWNHAVSTLRESAPERILKLLDKEDISEEQIEERVEKLKTETIKKLPLLAAKPTHKNFLILVLLFRLVP